MILVAGGTTSVYHLSTATTPTAAAASTTAANGTTAAAGSTTVNGTTVAAGSTATANGATAAGGTTASATATVQLTMTGALADYTAAKIDSIRSDLATLANVSQSAISLNVAAGSVIVLATMPAAAAADVVAKYNTKQLATLGFEQVRNLAGVCHSPTAR